MTQAAQPAKRARIDYSHGKELAIQVFLGAMAAMDLRPAMLAKLKLEGEMLKAGGASLSLKRPPRVVAFGKAANRMAAVLDEILGGRI